MFQSFSWWHAVAIFVVANAVSALPAGLGGDFDFYNNFRKPAIAPPDWAFAPVWLVLNVTSLIALYRVANQVGADATATPFYWAEFIGWITFAIFTTLYFYLRSPTLGAIDTVIGLVAAVISCWVAFRIDLAAGVLILLRVVWLVLASCVSVYVATQNTGLPSDV